jgi:hypothetical protein
MRAKIVVAYGTHLMHTLHILLNGKWDPISLLDDNDLWISSQSFIDATGHAVSAAEALNDILELDPDLSFMPFFFGIYLLQGSFLLLLIADKLQGEANPNVVKACETIVRAHEACIVTLNTEYQVSYCPYSASVQLPLFPAWLRGAGNRLRTQPDPAALATPQIPHTLPRFRNELVHANQTSAAKFPESHAQCTPTSPWKRHGRPCRVCAATPPRNVVALQMEWRRHRPCPLRNSFFLSSPFISRILVHILSP